MKKVILITGLMILTPAVLAQTINLDCKTKRSFDYKNSELGEPFNFSVDIDMKKETAESGDKIFKNITISPTLVTMKYKDPSTTGSGIFVSTIQVSREDLSVSHSLYYGKRIAQWDGKCVLVKRKKHDKAF